MSYVASLELCKTLFELSGWDETLMHWNDREFGHSGGVHGRSGNYELITGWVEELDSEELVELYPAYDLGYLLRKLPVWTSSKEHGPLEIIPFVGGKWEMKYSHKTVKHTILGEADTPEDAAAKLAIDLFKQGILNKETP